MKKINRLLTLLLLIPLFSLNAQSIQTNDEDDDEDEVGREINRFVDRITKRLDPREGDEWYSNEDTLSQEQSEKEKTSKTFSGDKVIEESETIQGDLVVKGGDLTVYGRVDGDVMVVGGDLLVKSTGRITGNARVINGSIQKDDGGIIEGYEDKTSAEKASYRESRRRFTRSGRSFEVPWIDEAYFDNFILRYNRVESVFLGISTPKKYYWDGERGWNAYGSLGWGFKSHTWRGNIGLSKQFAFSTNEGNNIFEFGAEGYSLTDTKDTWAITLHENTIAAFFFHDDFRDYFERNGYSLHAAYYTKHDYLKTELQAAYLADTYDSMTNKVEWALFGGDKLFRPNPAINPGKMRSALITGGLTTISKTNDGPEGWSVFSSVEFARKIYGGIFEFDQYIIDIRRLQPLGRYDNFNIRIRAGSASGTLPIQKTYELGGIGTLEGYPLKSEVGNRMLLINAEFIINGRFLDDLDFWPTWLFRNFIFILTSNSGFTRSVSASASAIDGFGGIGFDDFKHSFGFALGNRSGSFRIGMAWRTDYPAPAQFILRFNRPF